MKKKGRFFRILRTVLAVVFALALIFFGAVLWKWKKVSGSGEKVTVLSEASVPEKVVLGDRFDSVVRFRVPWGTVPAELGLVNVPDGLQTVAPPYFRRVKTAWGYVELEGLLPLQAYKDGTVKETAYAAVFEGKKQPQRFELRLPAFQVEPAPVESEELQTAAEVAAVRKNTWVWYAGIALLILLGIGLVFYFLRRKKTEEARIVPPWEKAVNAISDLLSRVRTGRTPPDRSIAELTDIVRGYIEKRFAIRAEHQTSDEFFCELKRKSGILNDTQQRFLRKFMESADLVKFARLPAEIALIEDAAAKAEQLVKETRPVPSAEQKEVRK